MSNEDRFVTKQQARAEGLLDFHPDYAIRLAKMGHHPKPVRLSSHKVGWMVSQLRAFREEKRAAA